MQINTEINKREGCFRRAPGTAACCDGVIRARFQIDLRRATAYATQNYPDLSTLNYIISAAGVAALAFALWEDCICVRRSLQFARVREDLKA